MQPLNPEPAQVEEQGPAAYVMASATPDDSVGATARGESADGEDGTADEEHLEALDQIRAAVLGACDGIVTTGALVTGIAAANATQHQLLLSAVASMASGSISMAIGEYVSMTQKAEIERAHGGPGTTDSSDAWKAALTSWACFIGGATFPTLAILLPEQWRYVGMCMVVVGTLLVFGGAAGFVSNTSPSASALRLVVGGVIAMVFTTAVGRSFGVEPSSSILVQMWSAQSNICSVTNNMGVSEFE